MTIEPVALEPSDGSQNPALPLEQRLLACEALLGAGGGLVAPLRAWLQKRVGQTTMGPDGWKHRYFSVQWRLGFTHKIFQNGGVGGFLLCRNRAYLMGWCGIPKASRKYHAEVPHGIDHKHTINIQDKNLQIS